MNQLKLHIASTAILSCLSTAGFAGWTSGGGHLRTTEQNPWFIQNTRTVSYCIAIDEINFGQTRELAKLKIENAIAYWKQQFLMPNRGDNTRVILGSQEFTETNCSDEVDIRFQFGVLDRDRQVEYLGNPSTIVGIAVRTAYNDEQLRGKGFIYISPEYGPLALKGYDLLPRRWRYNNARLLELVLIHELGHVFGIPHLGDKFDIMSEAFPDWILRNNTGPAFAATRKTPTFFGGFSGQGVEPTPAYGSDDHVLGLPAAAGLLKISVERPGMHFKVYAAESSSHPYRLLGTARVSMGRGDLSAVGELVLPTSQRVYPNLPSYTKSLPLYSRLTTMSSAIYTNEATQEKSPLLIIQTSDNFTIYGTSNTRPISEVFQASTWVFDPDHLAPVSSKN